MGSLEIDSITVEVLGTTTALNKNKVDSIVVEVLGKIAPTPLHVDSIIVEVMGHS